MKGVELGLRTDLFAPGAHVLVALSGGVDSLALLHLLVHVAPKLPIELSAVHVHHGMRGAAADADVEFLRDTCGAWRVPLDVVYRDVPALAAERGVGAEEAGRLARYEVFGEVARERGCRQVITAHHADDQVETLLLHLMRGASLDGLRGMPARRPLSPEADAPELIRPLLGVWRHELETYCRQHTLAPRYDVTNDDPQYRRNRIRQELMPLLDTLAPAARRNLLRLTQHAAGEVEVLEPVAQELLIRARLDRTMPRAPSSAPQWLVNCRLACLSALDVAPLCGAPAASVRRALAMWLRESPPRAAELSSELLDRILSLARGDEEGAIDLPASGLRVRRQRSQLRLERQHENSNQPAPASLPAPGMYRLAEFGLALALAEVAAPEDPRMPPDQACLAFAAVEWPLRLRVPHPGDRFQPLGSPGSRLLSDLFIDRKIPVEARRSWPVLEDSRGILWVCGLAVAERGRVQAVRGSVLRLRIEPLSGGSGG